MIAIALDLLKCIFTIRIQDLEGTNYISCCARIHQGITRISSSNIYKIKDHADKDISLQYQSSRLATHHSHFPVYQPVSVVLLTLTSATHCPGRRETAPAAEASLAVSVQGRSCWLCSLDCVGTDEQAYASAAAGESELMMQHPSCCNCPQMIL
jgi:hypothetical protein